MQPIAHKPRATHADPYHKIMAKPVTNLSGVGEARAKLLKKLNILTLGDLLRYYPRAYENWADITPIASTEIGEVCVIKATVTHAPTAHRISGGKTLYKLTATDGCHDIALTFFNNPYIPHLLKPDNAYYFRGKVTGTLFKREMLSPVFMASSKHLPVLPVYAVTQGLSSRVLEGLMQKALDLLPDALFDPIPEQYRQEYALPALREALGQIHFPTDADKLAKAKRRFIFEEFLTFQLGLFRLKRAAHVDNRHRIRNEYPAAFTALLPFELTGAQKRVISEAIADMSAERPMNRLVQGDVGSGKTAVAAALCWSIIQTGKQAAFMAPTEILASQHFQGLSSLLHRAGIHVALLTGSMPAAAKRQIRDELAKGKIDLLIGTHALISDDVQFQNLGLVVTDEQHRFGVNQRLSLSSKGDYPHLLIMSATPIPRTLALLAYAELDISVLDELPPGRVGIETYLIDSKKRPRAFSYIQKHLDAGRQAYLICPAIERLEGESNLINILDYEQTVRSIFPNERIAVLHGKMKAIDKEQVMRSFQAGEVSVLIATTVVEVGVDVPNAVIMLIENAERYGLSQLHQLRGRIGRGKHASTCIMISDATNEETLERLLVLRDTNDGFKIAEADLRLRGPGDFFGQRQHGMPTLKIADLANDLELLISAQACAKTICEAGDLDSPVGEALLHEVNRLFGGEAQVAL